MSRLESHVLHAVQVISKGRARSFRDVEGGTRYLRELLGLFRRSARAS